VSATADTTTLRVVLPVFPAASTFWYVRIYVPVALVFTLPELALAINPAPSTLSVHVAHDSVYVPESVIAIVPLHTSVTTGGVVSIVPLDRFTVRETVFHAFPAMSV